MNLSLENKHALVFGASRGIGQHIAIQLASQGASICAIARSESKLQDTLAQLDRSFDQEHSIIVGDVMDIEDLITKILAEGKAFSILINNTGGPASGPLLKADTDALMRGFQMHIIAAQRSTQTLVPMMQQVGYGRIINIISTSVKEPIAGLGVSNTIRGAMGNWSKTMATELGPLGITVNNILPGFTATERLDSIIAQRMKQLNKSKEEMENIFKSVVPLGRFAIPEETANAAGFLASPAAAYINGINVPVDGGRTKSL